MNGPPTKFTGPFHSLLLFLFKFSVNVYKVTEVLMHFFTLNLMYNVM